MFNLVNTKFIYFACDFVWRGCRPQHPLDGPLIRSARLLPSNHILFLYDARTLTAFHIGGLSGGWVVEDPISHEITREIYSRLLNNLLCDFCRIK